MIIIERNGTTTVYKGWRAWSIGAVVFLAAWLVFALVAFVIAGAALTVSLLLLLMLPALSLVAILGASMRRPRT